MSTAARIARLRRTSPAAADLALTCSLAVRVEPALLRALRLLLPCAGADAEADLYFSDLVTARDVTAITLDPPVARLLRRELAAPAHARLLDEAWQLLRAAHRDAHWSVRLEERLNHLDATRPPDARERIEELVLAGLAELARPTTRPQDRRNTARWLLGALARFPAEIAATPASRAAQVAAGALLDGRAGDVGDRLTPEEGEAWLPWLLDTLPTTGLYVELLDGAVVLGATASETRPNALLLEGVPQTDPLVVEVRWQDGTRARTVRVGVTPGDPVRVETGTSAVTLAFLSGLAYRLQPTYRTGGFDEPWHAAVKARLRPCLARTAELADLRLALMGALFGLSWIVVWGPPGCGKSTVLVAATDELRALGIAVIEHFYGAGPAERDEPDRVEASLLAQLSAEYPEFDEVLAAEPESGPRDLGRVLHAMARTGVLSARPLVVMLDGLVEDEYGRLGFAPLGRIPEQLPDGVRCLLGVRTASRSWTLPNAGRGSEDVRLIPIALAGDQEVCRAMLARDRAEVDRALAVPHRDNRRELIDLVDALPGRLDRLLGWLRRQPAESVEVDDIPPSLTTRWSSQFSFLTTYFSFEPTPWLLLLAAADGRNTWLDCAQSSTFPQEPDMWAHFKGVCTETHLVEPSAFDGLVHLTDPSVGERLRELDADGTGVRAAHTRLANLAPGPPTPLAVELASRTRRAAAVHHALEADRPLTAVSLCLDLRYLRARYADDPTGLAADLAEAADRTGDPVVAHVRQAVHVLAAAQVPPAAFAVRLHDRLHAQATPAGWFGELFTESLARAPLRVSHVLTDHQMTRGSALARHEDDPYLAGALLSGGILVLLAPTTAQRLDYRITQEVPGGPLRGAVAGPGDRIVAWSDHEVIAVAIDQPTMLNVITLGRLAVKVDFAAATTAGAVLAAADGTVQYFPSTGSGRSRLLTGHGARITAAAGRLALLTAGEDGTVRLWDADRDRARVFTDGRGAVRCVELLDNGPGFVTGGDDGWVRWWDPGAAGRSPIARRSGHEAPVLALTELRDGRVVSASADGTLRVWDQTGADSLLLTGHEDAVTGCRQTAYGILSWSADGTVRHWSPDGGPAWEVVRGFPGGIRSVSVAGDVYYAVLCGDGSVERRALSSAPGSSRGGRGCLAIAGNRAVTGLGPELVTVNRNGIAEGFEMPGYRPVAMSVATDGPWASVLDSDGRVHMGRPGREKPTSETEWVREVDLTGVERLTWLPNGVLATSSGRQLRLTGETRAEAELPSRITALAPVGRMAAAGTEAGNVHLFYAGTGRPVRALPGGPGRVNAMTTVGGNRVATGTADGTIRLLPLDSPTGPTEQLLGHTGAVTALAGVGSRLVSGGADGRLLLWHPGTPDPVHTVVLDGEVTALAAGDGWLAARDDTGNLWLLELDEPGSLPPDKVAELRLAGGPPYEPGLLERLAPDRHVAAEFLLVSHTATELSAVTARAGDAGLPIDLWLAPATAGTPQPADQDPGGRLRLPLWLRPGEAIRLWALSATEPATPVVVECLVSSPQLDGTTAVLTFTQTSPTPLIAPS
ncbi:hypothetical protein [Kitasatospora sp. NPDC093558]|uniref:NACHT and WD repeat domain-containing protein n=1 Tax=Kitasatospora sp. NPDC093558 TaxID=3155201 RepID=UPI00341FA756